MNIGDRILFIAPKSNLTLGQQLELLTSSPLKISIKDAATLGSSNLPALICKYALGSSGPEEKIPLGL